MKVTLACLLLLACQSNVMADRVDYAAMQVAGTLDSPLISESSGLAASRLRPDMLWTHNDSGDTPQLFLINNTGQLQAICRINLDRAIDWEDMASFDHDGKSFLLVGDIGDNHAKRGHLTLHLIEEPDFKDAELDDTSLAREALSVAQSVNVTFSDGPRDCESLAYDPTTGQVVLVSKEQPRLFGNDKPAGVYVFNWPWDARPKEQVPVVADRVADLKISMTTAMDISPDGQRCILLTYGSAYQFTRNKNETWATAFNGEAHSVLLGPRGQSEAVAYGSDGETLYLTAEKTFRPLWRVDPKDD